MQNNLIEPLTTSKSKTLALAEFFESRSEHYINHVNSILEMIGETDVIEETNETVTSIMNSFGYGPDATMSTSGGTFLIKDLLDTAIDDIENGDDGKVQVTSDNGQTHLINLDEIVSDMKASYHASISSAAALRASTHSEAASRIASFNDYISGKFSDVYDDLSGYSSSLSEVLRSTMDSNHIVDSVMEFLGFGSQDDDVEWFDEEQFIDQDQYRGSSPIPAITFPAGEDVLDFAWESFKWYHKMNWKIVKGIWKGIGIGVAKAGKFIKEVAVDPVDLKVINPDGDGTIEGFARSIRNEDVFATAWHLIDKWSDEEYELVDENTISLDTVYATINFRVKKTPLIDFERSVFIHVRDRAVSTTGFSTVKFILDNDLYSFFNREEGNIAEFSLNGNAIEIETFEGDLYLWVAENKIIRINGEPLGSPEFIDGYWDYVGVDDPDNYNYKEITYDANVRLKPINGSDIDLTTITGSDRPVEELISAHSDIAQNVGYVSLEEGEVEVLKGYYYSALMLGMVSDLAGQLARDRTIVNTKNLSWLQEDFNAIADITSATNSDFLRVYTGWDGNGFYPHHVEIKGKTGPASSIDIGELIGYFLATDVARKMNPGDNIPTPFVRSDILGTDPTYRIKTDDENRRAFLIALAVAAALVVTIAVGIPAYRALRRAAITNQLRANQMWKTLQNESLTREISGSEIALLRKQQRKARRFSRFISGLRVPNTALLVDEPLNFNPLGFSSSKIDAIDPKLNDIYNSIK